MDAAPKPNSPEAKMGKDQNQNIQVFVRVRPMNSLEKSKNSLTVLDCPGHREVVVKERSTNNLTKTFTFDRVFGPSSKQTEVYRAVVAPLIEQVLLGYNCTVFAYGQTGTGKTFTMEGDRSPEVKSGRHTWESDPLTGIVPRALSQLFDELSIQNAEFTVKVSHLELYNEELFDLLAPSDDALPRTLKLYEGSRKGSVTINGLEEVAVHNKHEVYSIMERGSIRRKTAATQMNATSSRSHTVFSLTVHITEPNLEGESLLKIGKLHLVDLAGSENIGRSGAVDKRAREAGSINQSLLTLGRVITALVEKAPHVPYRESKLTRILQDSLGGRTKTSIIATVSPASYNLEETLSTLDYAHRAKNITNRPEINQKLTSKTIMKGFIEEIERLRRDLTATREKNGVYLDQENYNRVTAQVETQSQDISNKMAELKMLKETLELREAELNCIQQQWQETKEDLATANQVIQETRNKLEQTQLRLQETEVQKEQQEFLVEKHVLTEKKLTVEAAQLISTTDESTSNLEKLYRKLDRKKNVELTNLEAGRRFNQDLGSQFNSLCTALEAFRVDHSSFCGVQRLKLESFLENRESQFSSLSDEIHNLVQKLSELFSSSKSAVDAEVISLSGWLESTGKEVGDLLGEESTKIDLWKDEITNEVILKLLSNLQILRDEMTNLGTIFTAQMTSQSALVNDYVITRLKKLEATRRSVETYINNQISANEKGMGYTTRTENSTSEYAKTFECSANVLIQELQKMVHNTNAFHKMVSTDSSSQINSLKTAISDLETFGNDIRSTLDSSMLDTDNFKNNSSDLAKSTEAAQKAKLKICEKTYKENKEIVFRLKENVEMDAVNRKESLHKFHDHLKGKLGEKGLQLSEFEKEYGNAVETFDVQCKDRSTNIFEMADEQEESDQKFIQDSMRDLTNHCKSVSQFADENRAVVLQQSGKLCEFWESTYQIDMPSGMTPQKKLFEFPRQLSATSPHERILSRFTSRIARPLTESNDL